jgi:hypothetical protein
MKTALDEAMEDARHYHDLWKAAVHREERLQEELHMFTRGPTSDAEAEEIGQFLAGMLRRIEGESGAWDIVQGVLAEDGYMIAPSKTGPSSGPCQCDECQEERNRAL